LLITQYALKNNSLQLEASPLFNPTPETTSLAYQWYCDLRNIGSDSVIAFQEYATFMLHVRAVLLISLLMFVSNIVLATGVLLFRPFRT
jgi:hypothetical protein